MNDSRVNIDDYNQAIRELSINLAGKATLQPLSNAAKPRTKDKAYIMCMNTNKGRGGQIKTLPPSGAGGMYNTPS